MKNLSKIIAILSYIILLGVWAAIDAGRNNQGLDKLVGVGIGNDIASFISKYIFAFVLILWVWYKSRVPYSWEVLGVFLMFSACGWITVDGVYNIVRETINFMHVGTTSWSDRLFQIFPYPFVFQMSAKVVMLAGGLFIYKKFQE